MLDAQNSINEIEQLLDELESFAERSPWYLPNKIAIRDEDFFRITQRIRELLPQELNAAREMLEKKDLILRNAQDEHRRILDSAEKRLADLTSNEQVVIVAKQDAERIAERARLEAEATKRDALLYTLELLQDMEKQFSKTLGTISRGREFVEAEINEQVEEHSSALLEESPKAEGAESAELQQ